MTEKFWKLQDHKDIFTAVFTNLKAFDCISHELLIVKLNAYEFDKNPLNFIVAVSLIGNKKLR